MTRGLPLPRDSEQLPSGVGHRPRRDAMSLKPTPVGPVPELTAFVARAAFPKGNPYLRLRDERGAVFADDDFADLFPRRGRPALALRTATLGAGHWRTIDARVALE